MRKKPIKPTKKAIEKWHFRARMKERYGIVIRKKDIVFIRQLIEKKKIEYTKRRSCWRWYVLLDYRGIIIYIVYDKKRKVPVTALPRGEFFNYYKKRRDVL